MSDVHMTRIENSAGSGVCDVSACWQGTEVWIELKVAKGRQVYVRPSQIAWISKRMSSGGRCWFLIRRNDSMVLVSGKKVTEEATPCNDPRYLKLNVDSVQAAARTTKPFDWELIKSCIFSNTRS